MKRMRGKILIGMGLLCITGALCLGFYNLWDDQRAGASAGEALAQLENRLPSGAEESAASAEDETGDVQDSEREMPVVEADGCEYIGTIEIPVLELELPIISEWSYSALKLAPCRYKGSAYLDNMIIAGHNYRTHFGKLKRLTVGDEVIFTDVEGNRFEYAVSEMEELAGSAIEDMEAGGWDLTLFTCTLGGKARVTVRCERQASDS